MEGFKKLVQELKKNVREMAVSVVVEKMEKGEKIYLVDVREDDEWRAGLAQGAIHIGKGVIERDIETDIPDKNATIVLYCGGGSRASLAAHSLGLMEYKNVAVMTGGYRGWTEAGLPEEKN